MAKRTLQLLITAVLMMGLVLPESNVEAYAQTTCVVNYYYTSSDNPEPVPKATRGTLSGVEWKIKPAGTSKKTYTNTRNGRQYTYTFDGWYTNINCVGRKFAPGKTVTAIEPQRAGEKYTAALYGKWICTKGKKQEIKKTETQKVAASERTKSTKSADGVQSTKSTKSAQKKSAQSVKKQSVKKEPASVGPALNKPAKQAPDKITAPITKYTFSDTGETCSLKAKASAGSPLKYVSDAPGVVSVDSEGTMKSKAAGHAVITISLGDTGEKSVTKKVDVTVPAFPAREKTLAPWKHILIDTYFYINGRAYSRKTPGKYWEGKNKKWSGRTGKNGKTQSCVTLPTVSLKRFGMISKNSGNIWLSSNHGKSPNKTVRSLKKNSKKLDISYPHKPLKKLVKSGTVKYGDIVCRSGHTFIYMGKDNKGNPLIFESGTPRDIGGGTRIVWGHNGKGRADKLTGKINKQIKESDTKGAKWKRGELSDDAFMGHRASGKNLNGDIHIVCSIRTFKVRTRCTNGIISPGKCFIAGQNAVISYKPDKGRKLSYVEVDGKRQKVSKNDGSYTFKNLGGNHLINVVYE